MTKIGVIGQGFVGGAVAKAFREVCGMDVETYDKYVQERSTMDVAGIVEECPFIFACVPTPMNDDGSCDTSIIESVVAEVDACMRAQLIDSKRTLVIKSTIPPCTTESLQAMYNGGGMLDIVFNPEFLNARSAYDDFVNQDHVVLGGSKEACDRVAYIYRYLVPDATMCIVDSRTAETIKYAKNCFFAVKVSYANEVYQMCQALGVDYSKMIEVAKHDDRMGWEHWKVPGPTLGEGPWKGQRMLGWGGPCLIKDLNAFMALAESLSVKPTVMRGAWEKNLEVRPRDWEYIASAVKNVKS